MEAQSPRRPTCRVETLGCKSNQYDSQRIIEALEALGYVEAGADERPDVIVVNTCTVTHTADRKARQMVRHAIREDPAARVFVTGCYAELSPRPLRDIKGVAGVYGRDEWPAMFNAIAGAGVRLATGDFGLSGFCGRARALLKIQDGCDAFCSYCIVPHARGRPRSRPLQDAAQEAVRLVEAGFREIVLTGIHLGFYGRDLEEDVHLPDAVRAVAATCGLERLRLSSIEPLEATDSLLNAMRECPAVCAHLHLPLQSGDDRVLARMARPYTTRQFLDIAERARERLDNPAITTDVLVGFPGETDEEFENTLAVCRRAAFSRMHAFPFSPRPRTPAATMPAQVPSPVARERVGRLTQLADEQARAWAAGFVGREVEVLFEERGADGRLSGYTERYVRLHSPGGEEMLGRTARVQCAGAVGRELMGVVLDCG